MRQTQRQKERGRGRRARKGRKNRIAETFDEVDMGSVRDDEIDEVVNVFQACG